MKACIEALPNANSIAYFDTSFHCTMPQHIAMYAIKQDIASLRKRFITVDATEKCSACALALMTRQFYVFPCHHTFHADCLIGLVSTVHFLQAKLAGRSRLSLLACSPSISVAHVVRHIAKLTSCTLVTLLLFPRLRLPPPPP